VTTVGEPAATDERSLHITWYGHASALVEIENCRVLIDPVWSDRVSPTPAVGPARLHPPPVSLDELGPVDAVVISHDHYDHLDLATIKALAADEVTTFLVPLGVGAHLEHWGVAADRIAELDWDESATVAGVRFTITPARHFSGRGLTRDNTLWGSWVIAGETRRLFYSGDTGYFDGFARIGAEYGPFDASLIQVGAYNENWADIHMMPEDALTAHLDVRGGLLIPVHWCTFVLALHDWSEPVERLWRDAKERDVTLAVPRPGERVDVDNPPEVNPWWQPIA
jgi:L-ascorbate metabolism protein UlaG (beta-lactamase superfamily)